PKRPQDRVELSRAKSQFEIDLESYANDDDLSRVDASLEGSFPASDPLGFTAQDENSAHEHSYTHTHKANAPATASHPTEVVLASGEGFVLDHGAVAIAAITSCTNTSNPSVMLAAGLLARNASKKGLTSKPWV